MSTEDGSTGDPILVPWQRLSEAALRAVIEEYVTSEGTEYGFDEIALDDKVRDVRRQLERGEAHLIFDPKTSSVNLVPR